MPDGEVLIGLWSGDTDPCAKPTLFRRVGGELETEDETCVS
jgi:hypothetical protein